jgi:pyruvate,water dikinase
VRPGRVAPTGFVVTGDAYLHALGAAGGRGELRKRITNAATGDPSALAHAAKQCQALVRSAGMPEAVRRAVLDAYARLGTDVPVTVRVSGTNDHAAPVVAAALNPTFTDVRGALPLLDRIVDCWASRWSPQLVAYRTARGIPIERAVSVVVEPMVDIRTSGCPAHSGHHGDGVGYRVEGHGPGGAPDGSFGPTGGWPTSPCSGT